MSRYRYQHADGAPIDPEPARARLVDPEPGRAVSPDDRAAWRNAYPLPSEGTKPEQQMQYLKALLASLASWKVRFLLWHNLSAAQAKMTKKATDADLLFVPLTGKEGVASCDRNTTASIPSSLYLELIKWFLTGAPFLPTPTDANDEQQLNKVIAEMSAAPPGDVLFSIANFGNGGGQSPSHWMITPSEKPCASRPPPKSL